jgi:hypothetical protein
VTFGCDVDDAHARVPEHPRNVERALSARIEQRPAPDAAQVGDHDIVGQRQSRFIASRPSR